MDMRQIQGWIEEIVQKAAIMDARIAEEREEVVEASGNTNEDIKDVMAIAVQTHMDQHRCEKAFELLDLDVELAKRTSKEIFDQVIKDNLNKQFDETYKMYAFLKHFLKETK